MLYVYIRNLKIIDSANFQHDLKQELHDMVDITDMEELYQKVISAIESTINSNAPLKQKKTFTRRKNQTSCLIKKYLPWRLRVEMLKEDGLKQRKTWPTHI